MEVSALKYSGGIGLHGPASLLRLQSDERLVALTRRGSGAAFEALVGRYESRLLAFCRHLLGSREDAEDVLQEVLAAAFNAMLADERPINARPWLYRIARNRSLNHLRRAQAVGVDSMDVHFSDNGASTADKAHDREEFRLLVGDIHELPETQRTALVLREMDALSYEQIAEAMETTVPSVKSLLVRARVSLAEASEARLLSCEEVRTELGEIAEGLRRRPSPLVRRHLGACKRCCAFRVQLKQTNKALAVLLPVGPLLVLKKLALVHLWHTAGAGSTATAGSGAAGAAGAGTAGSGAAAAGTAGSAVGAGSLATAAAGSSILAGPSTAGFVSAGLGAVATKAAAGLAAAALVTAGAVEVDHGARIHQHVRPTSSVRAVTPAGPPTSARSEPVRGRDAGTATGTGKMQTRQKLGKPGKALSAGKATPAKPDKATLAATKASATKASATNASAPAVTEPGAAATDGKPATAGIKAASTDSKPATPGTKPAATDAKPATPGTKPASTDAKSADAGSKRAVVRRGHTVTGRRGAGKVVKKSRVGKRATRPSTAA